MIFFSRSGKRQEILQWSGKFQFLAKSLSRLGIFFSGCHKVFVKIV